MRLPLGVSIESRDGGVTKDCVVKNGIVESRGQDAPTILRKRPGLSDSGLIHAGTAQALTYWNSNAIAVIGDVLCTGIVVNFTQVTTWNPSDKDSDITLSNGNLTAASTSPGSGSVRSVRSISTGVWYFETTFSLGGTNGQIGVANASAVITNVPGQDNNAVAYYRNGGVLKNNTQVATGAVLANGSVVGVLVNADARTVSFYKDGVFQCTVSGSNVPTGALYAITGANGGNMSNISNFGGSSFAYSVTSGTTTSLSPTSAGLQFSMQDNGSNAPSSQLMLKNASQAWTLNAAGTLTQITDVDYPGTYAVTLTSLTRSGTTATATTAVDTNFQVGSSVVIAGAGQSDYNGTQIITGVTASTSAASPDIEVTITRSSTTATVTTVSKPHGFTNGQIVTITGSDQSEYNGAKTITWISATSFSFTVTVTTGITASAATATGSPIVAKMEHQVYSIQGARWNGAVTAGYLRFFQFSNLTVSNGDTITLTGVFGFPDGNYTVANAGTSYFEIAMPSGLTDNYSNNNANYYSRPASTLTSITRSGTTFTFTFSAAHHITSVWHDTRLTISGATESIFNGTFYVGASTTTVATGYYTDGTRNNQLVVTGTADAPITPATGTIIANSNSQVATGPSFTFTVANSPTTPATGTITATGGRNTVRGIAYLDGYFVVMDVFGVLYNSVEDDPSTWNALEYVTALAETGAGKAIARSLNYIVAFKEWSTELFYNAANPPPGSPLGAVPEGLILVGCASGDSMVKAGEGLLFWLSQTKERGRSVHVMQGRQPTKISTPDVERILNADDLATVRAVSMNLDGHQLYLLTLETSNITLCYDMQSQMWTQWSSYTLGSTVSVSSITRSGTTATVTTSTAHGLSDGDPVKIAGANQSDYNGVFQAYVTSTTVFTIEVANSPTTPATGTITAAPYTESYFKFTKYADANGVDVMLHETDGHLYQVMSSLFQDNGIPINRFVRSTRIDGGTDEYKVMSFIRLIGDSGTGTPAIRWSDDDSATFASYRRIDMSNQRPETRRCGKFRRRSIEIRGLSNTGERWEAAEIEIGG